MFFTNLSEDQAKTYELLELQELINDVQAMICDNGLSSLSLMDIIRIRAFLNIQAGRIKKLPEEEQGAYSDVSIQISEICKTLMSAGFRAKISEIDDAELKRLWISEYVYIIDIFEQKLYEALNAYDGQPNIEYGEIVDAATRCVIVIERGLKELQESNVFDGYSWWNRAALWVRTSNLHQALNLEQFSRNSNRLLREDYDQKKQELEKKIGDIQEEERRNLENRVSAASKRADDNLTVRIVEVQDSVEKKLEQRIEEVSGKASTSLETRITEVQDSVEKKLEQRIEEVSRKASTSLETRITKVEQESKNNLNQSILESERGTLAHVLTLMGVFSAITIIVMSLITISASWLNGAKTADAIVAFCVPALIAILVIVVLLAMVYAFVPSKAKRPFAQAFVVIMIIIVSGALGMLGEKHIVSDQPEHVRYIISENEYEKQEVGKDASGDSIDEISFSLKGMELKFNYQQEYVHDGSLYFCEVHGVLE